MGVSPCGIRVLVIYKGLVESSGISSTATKQQAHGAEYSGTWQTGDGGPTLECGEWLGSILAQIREKAEELDSLLLFAIRVVEAGRPGNRLRLLPLRNTRLAINFEVAKFLKELEEVTEKW